MLEVFYLNHNHFISLLKKWYNISMIKKVNVFNEIEIFAKKLLSNYNLLEKASNNKNLFPVLKANAYGHGINECVKILDKQKPKYYAVDSYYEALKILKISKTPILIIGPSFLENIKYILERKITISVSNFSTLNKIISLKQKAKIHIFFNTGMNREGFVIEDLKKLIFLLKENKQIIVDGIMSHFSDADNSDNTYTFFQENIFSKILDSFEKNKIKPKWIHLGNSAGFLKTTDPRINSFRSGISIYGINPLEKQDKFYKQLKNLKPILRFSSTITDIQILSQNDFISYNLTYKTTKKTKIGIVPVGYHELLDRRLSNSGFFKYKNDFLPILGRVCMNLTTVDITNNVNIKIGSKIIIISEKENDKNSIKNMAKITKTIPYEILTNIKNTTRRKIIDN